MPLYNIENTETGDTTVFWGSYSSLQEKLAENPCLRQVISAPAIISGVSDNTSKLPDGFKDKLREIKANHPGATGMDHLI